jgi:hypothetical protein
MQLSAHVSSAYKVWRAAVIKIKQRHGTSDEFETRYIAPQCVCMIFEDSGDKPGECSVILNWAGSGYIVYHVQEPQENMARIVKAGMTNMGRNI